MGGGGTTAPAAAGLTIVEGTGLDKVLVRCAATDAATAEPGGPDGGKEAAPTTDTTGLCKEDDISL